MSTKAKAAVVRAPNQPMTIETIDIADPEADEVLVRIVSAGVCHTDAVMWDQLIPVPLPIVLGHEGSGIIEAVGPGVTGLAVGDPVVLSFDSCGDCQNCRAHQPAYCFHFGLYNFSGQRRGHQGALSRDGAPIHGNVFGQSSFATYAIAHKRNTVKVTADVPLEMLGPLGCGIQTGAGAVLNSLKVYRGSSIAIFGAGAVGLSAVMAAKLVGSSTIIVSDTVADRLSLARELGATHAVEARGDVLGAIRDACPHGLNFAFDTTGIAKVIEDAVDLLAPGGICGLVGASSAEAVLTINETHLMSGGRTLRGIVEGDSDPSEFIPRLIAHFQAGEFPFDRLITFYDFEDINEAFAHSATGMVVKPVLRLT